MAYPKSKKFISLQVKIQAIVICIIILPLLLFSCFFYISYSNNYKEQLFTSHRATVYNAVTALDYLFSDLRNSTLELYQEATVYSYLTTDPHHAMGNARFDLMDYMSNRMVYNQSISELHLLRTDGLSFSSSNSYWAISEQEKALIETQDGRLCFLGEVKGYNNSNARAYAFSRKMIDFMELTDCIGYLKVIVEKSFFDDLLRSNTNEETVNLLTDGNTILFCSDERYRNTSLSQLLPDVSLAPVGDTFITTANGQESILSYAYVEYPGWYYISLLPQSSLQTQLTSFVLLIALLATLTLIVCVALAKIFSQMVLRPLTLVTDSMRNLDENHYDLTIPEIGSDETTVLAASFNKMSNRINELINQAHVLELREKDAKIEALQASINPHFLYNTLDTICWMSRTEDAPETCTLVQSLTKLFRLSSVEKGRFTTVAQEIEYTQNYLLIQEWRYSGRIDFSFHVQPGLEDCRTIPFVLQPLIENAIIHGLENNEGDGEVIIDISLQNQQLVYQVSDNGLGADATELNTLMRTYKQGRRGLAISGVNTRIELCYGAPYGLRFERNHPKGLRATVVQPFIKGDDETAKPDDCR